MSTRADKFTLEQKKREVYSDFTGDFAMNPFTGALSRVTNEDSVRQALKNLVLTNCGERFYDSNKGSKVRQSLFELVDLGLFDVIKLQLRESLKVYEPRAVIEHVEVQPGVDLNEYTISVIFSIINIPTQNFLVTLNVSRVR